MKYFLLLIFSLTIFAQEDVYKIETKKLEEIRSIKKKFQMESRQARQQIREKMEEFDKLLTSDASEEKLRSQFQKIKEMRLKHQELRFNTIMEMRRLMPRDYRGSLKVFDRPGRKKFQDKGRSQEFKERRERREAFKERRERRNGEGRSERRERSNRERRGSH
jgi:hypothetical protein